MPSYHVTALVLDWYIYLSHPIRPPAILAHAAFEGHPKAYSSYYMTSRGGQQQHLHSGRTTVPTNASYEVSTRPRLPVLVQHRVLVAQPVYMGWYLHAELHNPLPWLP